MGFRKALPHVVHFYKLISLLQGILKGRSYKRWLWKYAAYTRDKGVVYHMSIPERPNTGVKLCGDCGRNSALEIKTWGQLVHYESQMIMFVFVTWNMGTTTGRQYVKFNSTLDLIFESGENFSQKVNGEKTNRETNKMRARKSPELQWNQANPVSLLNASQL